MLSYAQQFRITPVSRRLPWLLAPSLLRAANERIREMSETDEGRPVNLVASELCISPQTILTRS